MIRRHNNILLIAVSGIFLAILFAFAEMLAGLGTRWGFWHFRTGLGILKWAAYGEMAAVLVSFAGYILASKRKVRNALILSAVGFVIGITSVSVPLKWWRTAQSVPPIHDITTDSENPPQFNIIMTLRKDAPNPVEYGGAEISSQQHKSYPDIKPALLEVSPAQAFELCLTTARAMGWEIVNAKKNTGLIEATDTTFWFGFKDDIVIRITPSDKGSRIDVRSVSRVGKSDVGTNAKRIRNFLKKLRQKVGD